MSEDWLVPLRLPASAEILLGSVLAPLASEKTRHAYRTALEDFFAWVAERNEPLSKRLLETWRGTLLARGLPVSSVNQTLECRPVTLPASRAARGAFHEEALRLTSVANVKASRTTAREMAHRRRSGKTAVRARCPHAPRPS